jgi:hypothetical protein
MADFSKGIARWMVLSLAMAVFVTVPPEMLARGPDICLWKHLFHLAACPACGSTRALAAFFHGHVAQALAYNRNVMVTAPLLVGLLIHDVISRLKGPSAREF